MHLNPYERKDGKERLDLVHLADELVDVCLPISEITSLHIVLELTCPPSTSGVGELEGPEEVRGLT